MKVLPYTADDLVDRITEQSVDANRLAATVAQMQKSVAALAEWANAQIQAQNQVQAQGQGQGTQESETGRKKK